MIEHGVFIVPEVVEGSARDVKTSTGKPSFSVRVRVKHMFYAADGSHVDAVTAGEAMDSGDRATAKALTDAYKAAVFKVFCIPVDGDTDPEATSHELGNGHAAPNNGGNGQRVAAGASNEQW